MSCTNALRIFSNSEVYCNGYICGLCLNYWIKDMKPLAITFGALALLFQPFIKVALGRGIWNVIDVIVSLGLIGLYLYERKAGN